MLNYLKRAGQIVVLALAVSATASAQAAAPAAQSPARPQSPTFARIQAWLTDLAEERGYLVAAPTGVRHWRLVREPGRGFIRASAAGVTSASQRISAS